MDDSLGRKQRQDRSPAGGSPASPLRSIATSNLPTLLSDLGISLAISTYQAGYVILLRAEGESLNTHFRGFPRPMGIAAGPGRLAVGTARQVVRYYDMRAATERLDPPGRHDACFLPRTIHVTGDIDVHDLAWAGDSLWLVNTRLSCLCTLDVQHSFVPSWRPPFVSGYSVDDRCHLNGLAVVAGQPRYVTALAESDTGEGWRERPLDQGVLVDVPSGEIVAGGLSMPHSPRWHDDRLWVLESAQGTLGLVDLREGRVETVARMDGFTRGLDFAGPLAFVGVSQVRQSSRSSFGSLPVTRRVKQRTCGVSVIHLPTGRQIAFVRFEDAVQEIFAVSVLRHDFPEIVELDDPLLDHTYALPEDALRDATSARTDQSP